MLSSHSAVVQSSLIAIEEFCNQLYRKKNINICPRILALSCCDCINMDPSSLTEDYIINSTLAILQSARISSNTSSARNRLYYALSQIFKVDIILNDAYYHEHPPPILSETMIKKFTKEDKPVSHIIYSKFEYLTLQKLPCPKNQMNDTQKNKLKKIVNGRAYKWLKHLSAISPSSNNKYKWAKIRFA
eukprot:513515_1